MTRAQLDDPKSPMLWTLPGELTKGFRKHRPEKKRPYMTPLAPLAQRIVKPLVPTENTDSDLIFPGRYAGTALEPGSRLKTELVKHGAPEDFSYHAMRHTIATWFENNGHDEFDRALILNHSGTGVTAGYSHGFALDRKRALLEKWAAHVEALVEPAKGVTVLR